MDNGRQAKVKMAGSLYKKVKKRMISSWKMYWFVLEDRLLLYYRSKDEYQAISPCKGSINLGPPCIVKSCPSVTNAFQIETRTSTVTLRAETTEDQMKWMQTIMSALNQNQNFITESHKRLSHFRYSLNDLVPEREPNDCKVTQRLSLDRQNTMPAKMEPTRNSNEIIQRLQKIGAHSYGGSLGTISKMSVKKCGGSPALVKNKSLPSQNSLDNSGSDDKAEPLLRPGRQVTDNIYERISGDSNSSRVSSNRTSFIVDNENYSVPLRKTPGKASTKDTKSLLVENDQYGAARRIPSEEVIYAEPKVNELTDHNKNSVLVENTFYITNNDNRRSENLYEDVDFYNHYSQPVLKSEETSSQSSQDCKKKARARSEEVDEKGKEKIKKSKSFIKRVWKKRSKKVEKQESQDEEELYEEVDKVAVEKIEPTNDSTVQMLSELQNILEHKKTLLRSVSANTPSTTNSQEEKPPEASTSNSDVCPSLPPKKSQSRPHNQPIELEKVRSLDEILEDLDKEKLESKTKVKILIEKFSEPESDDVILRKHNTSFRTSRDSDELNKLLNELSKVTSAPIMTPGVTSSLVNPNLTDEEWIKLLPVRQRRLSEPDYDVPRPHKSIQLPAKLEKTDAIPATRFFGPVLPPTITDSPPGKEESLCTSSMTPDSLEVESSKSTHHSFSSHSYYHPNTDQTYHHFPHNYKKEDDKIIYAMPKSYLSVATHIVNTCQNICTTEESTIIYKNVKNVDVQEEMFSDSLELCNNQAPEF